MTRKSAALEDASSVWCSLLRAVVGGAPLRKAALAACQTSPLLRGAAREIAIGKYDAVVS